VRIIYACILINRREKNIKLYMHVLIKIHMFICMYSNTRIEIKSAIKLLHSKKF